MPITMKDIAREFGVSVATVSRALSDNPRISKQRRNAIQAYAKAHNFYPNAIGAQLRLNKERPLKLIGVIVPQLPHYYFSTILSGIEEEASTHGYMVIFAQSNETYEREARICQQFFRNKVCGVIVSQAKDTRRYDHFQQFLDSGIPIVFYDRICTGIDTSRVVVDDYMGAFNAVSHLIETGCRRIAFFGSDMSMQISKNRYNGYRDALFRHGIEWDESLVCMCDNRQSAEVLTPAFLNRENRPDAFFAVNDDTAIGILYATKKLGLRVPEEVSICGFTNGERAVACDPMLTTVEQRGKRVGEEAANILISQVEGHLPMDKVEKRVVRTKLIVRGTSR